MTPLPHHRAPEERSAGGVVGWGVYRVEGGDIEGEDASPVILVRDIGDGCYVVELEEFSGKEHIGTEWCGCVQGAWLSFQNMIS